MKKLVFIVVLLFSVLLYAEIPGEITAKLNSKNLDEQSDACLVLGRLGDPSAVPILKEKLKSASMLVRHSAANALARIGGEEVNNIFREMINSQSPEKKRIGLAGLAMTGDPESVEIVVQELNNPDWQVRWSAVYALGQWGYRPALSKLQEIARTDPYKDSTTGEYSVRKRAKEVCKKIVCAIEWYRSLDNAKVLAEKLGKPLLVYWYVYDNPLCRQMEEEIFVSQELSDITQGFICVKMDVEENAGLISKYNITAVPCILIFDKNTTEADRITGLETTDNIIIKLKNSLERKGTSKELKELVLKNPSDIESSWHLAEWYLDNGMTMDALPLLSNIIRYDPKNNCGYTDNAIFVLGFSFGAIGEYKRGASMLEKLRKEYPNFKDMDKALYCLGLDYLSINKKGAARKVLEELIMVYPESKTAKPAKEIIERVQTTEYRVQK